jgi:hypothetical protein
MRHPETDSHQAGHRKPKGQFTNLMTYKNTNRSLNLGGTMGLPMNKNVELSDAARQ